MGDGCGFSTVVEILSLGMGEAGSGADGTVELVLLDRDGYLAPIVLSTDEHWLLSPSGSRQGIQALKLHRDTVPRGIELKEDADEDR